MTMLKMVALGGYQFIQGLGFRVDRAAAALPATSEDLFTISGGRVLMTAIIGEVTVVVQTQANDAKLVYNPDATGADQDLCAVLDISADPVGEMYTITGIVANAMRSDLLIAQGMTNPLVLSEGVISLAVADENSGSVAWTLFYLPIDDGARVVAA